MTIYIHKYGMFTKPTEKNNNAEQKVNTDNKSIMTELSFFCEEHHDQVKIPYH